MAGKNNNNRQRDPGNQRASTDIPKFDLAEQIMAQQRKVAATRRKSPSVAASGQSKTAETASPQQQVEPISHTIEQPGDVSFEQGQIIAEIVARDIKRLVQGESRNSS
jgi:hypothetical protein